MKQNFRRGGLFMLPAVTIAIILALLLGAPWLAVWSIGTFGFSMATVLLLVGDKSKNTDAGA